MYAKRAEVNAPDFLVGSIAVRPNTSSSSGSSGGCISATNTNDGAASGAAAACRGPETLVISTRGDIARLVRVDGSAALGGYKIGSRLGLSMLISGASCSAYEPTADCVLIVTHETAILQLDSRNRVSLVAGNKYTKRSGVRNRSADGDGVGAAARFWHISALAPDGLGNVYIADVDRIRKLHLSSRRVETLPGSWPQGDGGPWVALSYDGCAHVLTAATSAAVCIIGKRDASTSPTGSSAATSATRSGSSISSKSNSSSSRTLTSSIRARISSWVRSSRQGAFVHLIAGDWTAVGAEDGAGAAARFTSISAMTAGANGQLYILDDGAVRIMDPNGFVSTAFQAAYHRGAAGLCVLPNGDLAIADCGGSCVRLVQGQPRFAPSSPALGGHVFKAGRWPRPQQPSAAAAELHAVLTASPATAPLPSVGDGGGAATGDGGGAVASGSTPAGGDGGAGAGATPRSDSTANVLAGSAAGATITAIAATTAAATAAAVVTLSVGGGVRFTVHRHVLTSRSDYFKQLLDPEAGFADSGGGRTGVVSLPDADPRVISWLLIYMYLGELHVPEELLQPAAALAMLLLLPADVTARLQEWLLAAVTPGSLLSDLTWAEQYGMDELAEQLWAYLRRHRRHVAAALGEAEVGGLVAGHPELAARLLRELAVAAVDEEEGP